MKCVTICVHVIYLLLHTLQLALMVTSTGEISSFTQFPNIVAPGENATFVCDFSGNFAEWRFDGEIKSTSDPENGIFIARDDNQLRLTVTGYSRYNESIVTCFVFPGDIRQDKVLIIAGPPSEFYPMISYNETGLSLTISWEQPFTQPGFNITEYCLHIANSSNDTVKTVPMGLGRVYVDTMDTVPSECNELEYTVIAYNSVGHSSATVSGGFPIPIDPVKIEWKTLYQNISVPHLEIWFQPFHACTFQQLRYSFYLEGVTENATTHSRNGLLYSVHEGLTVGGGNYTAVVEETSVTGVIISREDIVIEPLSFPCTQELWSTTDGVGTQELQLNTGPQEMVTAYVVVIGLLTVISALFLVLFLTVCFLYVKLRKERKGYSPEFVNPLSNTIAMGTNQGPNIPQTNSGTTKVNPIYDGGPVYDSCGSEPLRQLLSSTSTPSTPNTPSEETTTRYVFPPPELPPPRAVPTYTTVLDPATSSDDKKDLSAGIESPAKIEDKKDFEHSEYTMMQPACDFKPSPLLIST